MTTYYLRTDGDDGNDGLSNSPSGAWRTFAPGNTSGAHELVEGDEVSVGVGSGFGTCTPNGGNWTQGGNQGLSITGSAQQSEIEGVNSTGANCSYIRMSGLRITTAIFVQNGEGFRFYRNWVECGMSIQDLKQGWFENNYFNLGASDQLIFDIVQYGYFSFVHNTVVGAQNIVSPSPMIAFDGSNGNTPSFNGIHFYNNALKRTAGAYPRYFWWFDLVDWTHWDMFFHIEGNCYEYEQSEQTFGFVEDFFDPSGHSKISDLFTDWQEGFLGFWSGRDILGNEGSLYLGQDPDNVVEYSLGWGIGTLEEKSIAIDASLDVDTLEEVDIELTVRPIGLKADVGCYEVRPPLPEYTVFGFTSKVYTDVNEGGSTVQCAAFLNYELDYPDQIKFQVSFNAGTDWNTLLDTYNGIDLTEEAFAIPLAVRGHDLQWRAELWIHESNMLEPDFGTPRRVDLEYFSNNHLTQGVKAGTEVDIYDSDYHLVTRLVVGRNDNFETYLPPGTYNLKLFGAGHSPSWVQVDVGHGSFFGRYSEVTGDIWHQFYKAKDWTLFNGVQWSSYMVWEHFVDESLRIGAGDPGCPPGAHPDPYYPYHLLVRAGKTLKCRSSIDNVIIVMDPTIYPELG